MLQILGLTKTYPNGTKAIDNISLTIGTGMFGLLGPNGAGKSSLMRMIATLQEPDEGKIYFEGIDVLKQKDAMRSLLGYLPQEFGVYPNVSAEAMLDHLALLKGIVDFKERKNSVDALLEMTHLAPHRKKKLGGFSGGMKQRFGIAQALLGNPKLIIADEPTAGLDPEERERFLNLLTTVSEEVTLIFSTHIVSDVSALCQDIAILNTGKVLLTGPPERIIGRLKSNTYEATIPKQHATVYSQTLQVLSSRPQFGKVLLHIFSKVELGEPFHPVEPNLEDVYFAFIKGYAS